MIIFSAEHEPAVNTLGHVKTMTTSLFDSWAEKYDRWFETPTGKLVKQYESALLLELLSPCRGEKILDAGCGTGLFTNDVLDLKAKVTGLDISFPMLQTALRRLSHRDFSGLCGNMYSLPFRDNSFDKSFSMTAIEFIADAPRAAAELNRVTKQGGCIVITTLNSLSPWAASRKKKAHDGHALFQNVHFRSPDDMRSLTPVKSVIKTAVHFLKNDPVAEIPKIERDGHNILSDRGALLAVQWYKT